MEVGLSILLQLVVNFVVNNLEVNFFVLILPLNFKSYSIMLSNVISEDACKSSVSASDSVVSVMISTYPLANKGYLVSFFKDGPDGNFEVYDPVSSIDFVSSKLPNFLEFSTVLLPKACFYLPPMELGAFIRSLSAGASVFEMTLLAPTSPMQGLLMVQVDEKSLSKYEQEEED